MYFDQRHSIVKQRHHITQNISFYQLSTRIIAYIPKQLKSLTIVLTCIFMCNLYH